MSRAIEQELRRCSTEFRPSWESSNVGVHERVNFSDTLWGFDLAGGAYYNTPLRVTLVREGSRGEMAGIRVGDVLKSINGILTSTMTVQEAHDTIIDSGIEIKLNFSAPDVEGTQYGVYQDELESDFDDILEVSQNEEQKKNRLFKGAKINEAWSDAWPGKSKKRDVLWRESNCFMVPSKYEKYHRNLFEENRVIDEEQSSVGE